jgi:biopolymer transport protein ExbB
MRVFGEDMNSIEYVVDLFQKGGPIMWPLLVCSVIAMALALERIVNLAKIEMSADRDLLADLFSLVEKGKCDEAIEVSRASSDPAISVIVEGLIHRDHGLTDAMQVEAEQQLDRMRTGFSVLDTIITMAPLLGILGTVTGIIKSFNLLQGAGLQDPRLTTGGISEALITTAAGLTVALATLMPYNYLLSRLRRVSRRLEHTATQFEVVFRRSMNGKGKEPVS